jgi:hypothetical protein
VTFGEAGSGIGLQSTSRMMTGRERLKEFGQKPVPVLQSPLQMIKKREKKREKKEKKKKERKRERKKKIKEKKEKEKKVPVIPVAALPEILRKIKLNT